MSARDTVRMHYRHKDAYLIKAAIKAYSGHGFDDEYLDGSYAVGTISDVNYFSPYAEALSKYLPDIPWIAWAGSASEDGEVVFFYLPATNVGATFLVELARDEELVLLADDVYSEKDAMRGAAKEVYRIFNEVRDLIRDND